MQSTPIQNIVVVGGGSAGWLSAAIIAAHHKAHLNEAVNVTLVESSDIPTVGVGEGTWPTMKNTIRSIGLTEKEVFQKCAATFKQGGKFANWVKPDNEFYYHPFTVPLGYGKIDLAPYVDNIEDFACQSNYQQPVCEAGLAPRTLAEPEFQGQCNYAYHLDAGAFADLVKNHSRDNLGVIHIVDTVDDVSLSPDGSIAAIKLAKQGELKGDLFIDCTGFASLLLGKTMDVPFKSAKGILFNDRAIATQVQYDSPDAPIACHTIATGHSIGWTWDIGLTSRRGVGIVYSSDFATDEEAEQVLRDYIGDTQQPLTLKHIKYETGYREKFWHKNCVAIGLSAGFVEPLEATALMLIEISARYVAEHLPPNTAAMPIIEKRFNKQMHYRWRRIMDFLKLHYMLTERPEPYWQAHKNPESIPESLQEDLEIWRYRGPINADFDASIELFPAASYQYVLYGMGFAPQFDLQDYLHNMRPQAEGIINQNRVLTQQLLQKLPSHRQYINAWVNQ